jgi:hypothetical protein
VVPADALARSDDTETRLPMEREAGGVLGEDAGLDRSDPGGLGGFDQLAEQRGADAAAVCAGVDVHRVLDDGVRAPVGDRYRGDPAEDPARGVEGDVTVHRQLGGVELVPAGSGGLEGGVAFVDAESVDLQDLVGVLGGIAVMPYSSAVLMLSSPA